MTTILLLAPSLAHISLILNINNKNKYVTLCRNITVIISIIIDMFLLQNLWLNYLDNELYWKGIIVLLIIMALGTITSPILNIVHKDTRISKKQENCTIPPETSPKETEEKVCPNCKQEINPNWNYCPNCNQKIKE